MANNSAIQWTESTWNPATGCTKVSAGCKNCYAEEMAARLKAMGQKKYANGFDYTEHPDELDTPLHWKKPRKIFVNSMSDLFHERALDSFITAVFDTMRLADWHTYQVLTKRPNRMADFVARWLKLRNLTLVPRHIWLGTSVENHHTMDRIGALRLIPCIRFVSFEPLLEEIHPYLHDIHWAIVGGESGKDYRPFDKQWARSILEECRKYGTAFFFKQAGGRTPKAGGRDLDGKEYSEYPIVN